MIFKTKQTKKKKSYIVVSRQAVHLRQSALRVQDELSAHQHILWAFVPWTPKLQ